MKYSDIEERSEMLAEYIISHEATVRAAGRRYGVSKSTVHKDITVKLKEINPLMYGKVKSIIDKNKSERHIRGGEATKRKYREMKGKN